MRQRVIAMALVTVASLAIMLPGAAVAQGESVTSTIRYDDPESGEQVPAVGVAVTVTDANGEIVAETTTDEEGTFLVELPGPGEYAVLIDPDTLPEGVVLRTPDRNPAVVTVQEGQVGRTIFATTTGEGGGGAATRGITGRQVAQLTWEGLKLGLFIAMMAIGLSLIFGTTGLVNFSHGEMIGWGMLIAYLFNFYGLAGFLGFVDGLPAPLGSGMNLILAAVVAIAAGALLGWTFDRFIFGPLRRRGASLISQMVVTIGMSLVLRYLFLFAFGGTPRFFRDYTAQSAVSIGLVEITPKDMVAAGLSATVLVAVGLFLIFTRFGKAMRAVADNRDLAESSGIDVQRVIRFVWTLGGGLAALGGVMLGLSEQVSWNIGFRTLLLVFAGVILGGLGTAFGALVGSVMVGVGIQVSTLFIAPELKNVGALVVLILVLIVRPQGILGRKERVG
jgi:neutral amino acid transport system permease protein